MDYLKYLIIILVLVVIAFAIIKARKKDFKLEANKLIILLGGKDNVLDYEVNKSRFIVTLKDVKKANKEAIQKMGAKGIVEIDNQLKIILGPDADQIKKHINNLKWLISLFFLFLHNSTNIDKYL